MGIRQEFRTSRYDAWRDEVILDFGDYTFTRNELNAIDLGLHTKAARNLHRLSQTHKYNLATYRTMGLPSARRIHGMGDTTCIVLAHCLLATFEGFDIHKWMDKKIRTVRGGVLSMKKSA